MKEIIKNKKLKQSSRSWILRQLKDPYTAKAKKEGYRSRAAFKLLEIQKKFKIIQKNSIVLDLGASPGSWSQIASKLVQKVIAIDLLEMDPIQNVEFIQGDFLDLENIKIIKQMLDGNLFDVILSDMAPNTCGIKKIDHLRIMNLIEEIFAFCKDNLKIGGNVVVKTFQGGTESNLLQKLKSRFEKVIHFKPNSSRKESKEIYLIAMGFKLRE
ncbi:MAG: RlmE family RNA methyltransferase [Holosporales bacterium]|jgi:23S rRNA (uridine2552-2'-O)-methyltransferase|nr:RlmE family RNA methyltransferase [Holosporales bacterium]